MPRKPRHYLPNMPYHVVQRGNNRQPCFFCHDDYAFYMDVLLDALCCYNVHLHAFVLMTNHVHLLMTPSSADGISKVLQSVGRRYVRFVNAAYQRTGTLWEGRHKSSVVDRERYLLICYRYIELNPVRAGLVSSPEDYHWSSYHHNARQIAINCVQPHSVYMSLGKTWFERCRHYKSLFEHAITDSALEEIRTNTKHNFPIGNDKFRTQLEAAHGVRFGQKGKGRPKK